MAALFGRCARSREFLRVFLKKGAQMKLFLPVLFVCGIAAYAQDMLNDESIVKMVKAGLSEDLVSSPGESHPEALSEPYLNLSAHTAPAREPRRTFICQ